MHFNILREDKLTNKSTVVLAGEMSDTIVNLSLFKLDGDTVATLHEVQYKLQDHHSFKEIADDFLKGLSVPDSVCIVVSGSIFYNRFKPVDINWELNGDEIAYHLGIAEVHLISDHEAIVYALPMLNAREVKVINKGIHNEGNAVVIAPGAGLGEAGLYWDGNYYHPFATNGGQIDFNNHSKFDIELFIFLQKKFGRLNWDQLVSDSGIINIYNFLRDEKGRQEPGWLKEKFNNGNMAMVISQHVAKNELCKETMRHFISYLAKESANLVLKFNAIAGLYIAGPIAPMILPLLDNNLFHSSFSREGGMNDILEKVPVKIVLNTKTALLGAAWYGARNVLSNSEVV
jgi:glucokinase